MLRLDSMILALLALFLASCGSMEAPQAHAIIEAAVNHPQRPADDLARDRADRPTEILALLGIQPGMRVLDMNAATGYYTELLARVAGPRGQVIAHNDPGALTMLGEEALMRRYRDGRLPNVQPLYAKHNELHLAPASLDAVLMSKVYHDTYWRQAGVDWGPVDQGALLANLYQALRPGGVIGVIDHVAEAGSEPWETAHALHRIDPQIVRRDFSAAGFVLETESAALRDPQDDHRRSVFDSALQGRTDRFVMVFRRPR